MAMKQYAVDKALEMVFDNDFGLSEGYLTYKEEGEDIHAYLGEPLVLSSDTEALTHDVVSGDKDADNCDVVTILSRSSIHSYELAIANHISLQLP